MDVSELISILTEGLSPEQASVVKAAIERDSVKSKASGWRKAEEVADIQARATKVAELESELDGVDANGNPKGYRAWYKKYWDAVKANDTAIQAYEQKYGKGALQKALEGQLPSSSTDPNNQPRPEARHLTEEEIRRIARESWQKDDAPRVADTIISAGNILQKHLLAGRKNPVDFNALSKLAGEKYAGNVDLAYEEWDKPERERLAKDDFDKEIKRRVDEELQKRGAAQHFPAAADMSPSSLSTRSKETVEKFDRNSFTRDLAGTFASAGKDGAVQ